MECPHNISSFLRFVLIPFFLFFIFFYFLFLLLPANIRNNTVAYTADIYAFTYITMYFASSRFWYCSISFKTVMFYLAFLTFLMVIIRSVLSFGLVFPILL